MQQQLHKLCMFMVIAFTSGLRGKFVQSSSGKGLSSATMDQKSHSNCLFISNVLMISDCTLLNWGPSADMRDKLII